MKRACRRHYWFWLIAAAMFHGLPGQAFQEPAPGAAQDSSLGLAAPAYDAADPETGIAVESQPAPDPCELSPDRPLLGLDSTRRFMFDTVCSAARWLDGFFGDIRYDEAATGVRGRLSLGLERREGTGLEFRPRFRVRIPLPNLNERLSVYLEREDETRSIEGRNVEGQQAVEPLSTTRTATDSTQLGFARKRGDVDFRLGLRAPHGKLDYYARTRYRTVFGQTDATQWRFSETLYWRHSDGWGETTQLDFEARLSEKYFLRWYNSATWAQVTEGVSWNTGLPLYHTLSGGKVIVFEPNMNGQTGLPYAVSSYGMRAAYRQTLGRSWLFGELYGGRDWVKTPDPHRDAQAFIGFILELVFDKEPKGSEAAPAAPVGPGETSPVH
jgi:hypothetical protein